MKHAIFLDFDGVMHPVGSCVWNADEQAMNAVEPFRWWPALEAVLASSPVPIGVVVHSTWRLMWETDEEILQWLPPTMRSYVVGTTDRNHIGREKSIMAYVNDHGVANSIILDDEPKAFAAGLSNLIVCNDQLGVSDTRVLEQISEHLARWAVDIE